MRAGRVAGRLAALTAVLALAGCGQLINWWHAREGGVIAKPLPPVPGENQSWPSLGSIPPRPVLPDVAARQRISDRLAAANTTAQTQAAMAPLPQSLPPPPPAPPGAASASLAAASAPASSQPAPAAPAHTAPAAVPQTMPAAPPPPPPAAVAPAAAQAGVASAMPALPAGPPPAPQIPGVPIPTMPVSRVALPGTPLPAPSLPAAANDTVPVAFAPGSYVLPVGDDAKLRQLAARRRGHAITVVGRGDAVSADPNLQGAALQLGIRRAQAIAAALTGAGVPTTALRIDAQAAGRGGWARLVD